MKKIVRQVTLAAIAGTAMTVFSGTGLYNIHSGSQAMAQEEAKPKERKTRRTPAMREQAFRRLERAQEAMDLKDYETVVEELEDLRTMRGLNSFEEAQLWNFYAFYYYEINDVPGAMSSYERILELEGIPLQFEDTIRYQLAQLYFSVERYEESLELLNQWFMFAVDPQASAFVFKGNLHYVMQNYDLALPAFLKAIELAELSGGEVKENWYQILKTIYYEQKNFPKVRDVLEYLITNHSKPTYWLQLASIYSELEDEASQLATMEVAYMQGFLTEESHVRNLAQLYMANEVYIKSAEVMRKSLEEELVEREVENLELLANSYIYSKEFEDSIPPLIEAAELSEDGNLSHRLGQVYIEYDRWDLSIKAIKQALEKGDLDREDITYMILGMAYFNNDQLDEAKEAFQQSRKDRRSRKASNQWIQYIDNEKNRREQLALSSQ